MAFVQRNNTAGGEGSVLFWTKKPVGFSVEGTYLGTEKGKPYKGKDTLRGKIKKADGSTILVDWPAVLANEFAEDKEHNKPAVAPGSLVKIVYQGKVQGSSGTYHGFDVFVDDGTAASAPPQTTTQQAPADDTAAKMLAALQTPTQPTDAAGKLKAALEAKVGPEATKAMLDAIAAKFPGDTDKQQSTLAELCAAHGIKG